MAHAHRNAISAVFLIAVGAQAAACRSGSLMVVPELVESRYCGNSPGILFLWAKVRFTYRNIGEETVILPRFAQPLKYSLYGDVHSLLANRPEREERFSLRRLFDLTKLDQSKPDENLFDSIEPGASRARILVFVIVLRHPGRSEASLLGKDQYLRAEINQWFGRREKGEELRRRWREFGSLWIDNVVSEPLKLQIEENPVLQSCPVRVE